ncbi:MAG: asparagine synthase (glutamine-hydrolyzing) [Chloroflexi bacterium]|nr:asparagine synthase (glutamine-hydrolyzing) [Chloroflexota bacterium]
MCGIAGVLTRVGETSPDEIARMVDVLRHRGPDAAGLYVDDRVALGHARLSIVDLSGGLQPLTNEDESVWLICNGEIFNHVELRDELRARGHRFRTGSDCETILHLYEERGDDCVHALNGDFAFALWDRTRQRLVLARDRVGVRPLYYTQTGGRLIFSSEIKALLTQPDVPRQLDLVALSQVFTTWSPVPPRTMFEGIESLLPGHLLIAQQGRLSVRQYWQPEFPPQYAERPMRDDEAAEQLRALLSDATRLRLQADVPVGAYVSGGLDSSAVTALAQRHATMPLQTFAVAFTDGEFDERPHQDRLAAALGTQHHTITCGPQDIAKVFPEVVWHAETPLLRTAPAPLFLLAGLVRQSGLKVVLTGEGADEFLVGYDIFKEAKVRAFWARQPDSALRPRLLRRLYGHIPELARPSQAYLEAFFGVELERAGAPNFSHAIRWRNTGRLHRYFTEDVQAAARDAGQRDLERLLADQRDGWDPVSRAQHAEIVTFLNPYLLSSQGDRVAMAHAVEGRFPFLDYRVIEFCNRLPSPMKLAGLNEKAVLKRAVADLLPPEIARRTKQPFRAPIRAAFAGPSAPDYAADLLEPSRIAADGVFKPAAATWLLNRARQGGRLSEIENMALVGMVSFGLFRRAFWDEFSERTQGSHTDTVIVRDFRAARAGMALAAAR